MTSKIIDAHMHLFAAQSQSYPRGTHDLYPPDLTAEVDEYLAEANALGVGHSVLVSLDENDEYVAEAVANNPGRFSGVAVMDPASTDPVADFEKRRTVMPLVGYRVWTLGASSTLDVPQEFRALLNSLQERQVAMWFYSDEDQLNALASVIDEYPDLTVVLNHLGFCQSGFACDEWGRPRIVTDIPPATIDVVERLSMRENVNVMFSGHYAFSNNPYPYDDMRRMSQRLLDSFGPDRMLWASDWPWIKVNPGYFSLIDLVDLHLPGLSDKERMMILGGTAERVLRLAIGEGA